MKVHLLDSSDPLKEGVDYTAMCQAKVRSAHFAFTFDSDIVGEAGEALNSLTTCRICIGFIYGKRYLYGLVNGEEAKHANG